MAAWRRRCRHTAGGVSLAPPLDPAPAPAPAPNRSAAEVCPARGCQCRLLTAMDAPEAPGPGRKELKIVIVGDGGCGKTSLLMVYSQGSFPEVRPAGGLVGVRLRGKRAWDHRGRRLALSLDRGSPASR